MDRTIEKKKGMALVFSKKALPYWGGGLLLCLIGYILIRDNVSTLRVNAETLSINKVMEGEFNDYIRISGQVQPMTTIQLSPLETGVVKEIFMEEGSRVKAGDKILRLTNENLDMQILNSEADLAEKENLLRNTIISMEQQRLSVNQEMLQLEMEVRRYRRAYESQKSLYAEDLIAKEDRRRLSASKGQTGTRKGTFSTGQPLPQRTGGTDAGKSEQYANQYADDTQKKG